MSEYQYYEFVAVDRPLDADELNDLRALSTRAEITPTSFVNHYQWGDFKGDPRRLMEKYFDAFLYLANWGTRQLMIRLPARLLDLEVAQQYCVGDLVSAWEKDDHVILALGSEDEEGDWAHSGERWLASIIPTRAAIASGDLRMLYLAWLSSAQTELDEDEPEPPVPPNLGSLTGALRSFCDFLRIDPDLLAVAAEASDRAPIGGTSGVELEQWIADLPVAEKNALLLAFVKGDDPHLRTEVLRRLAPKQETAKGCRTVGELLNAAQARRDERDRSAAAQRERDRIRREKQAVIAREEHLESVAAQEEYTWHQVSRLIETKKAAEYDQAAALLIDLREVSERKGRTEVFDHRVERLRQAHGRKPSLMARFDRAGL